MHLGTSSSSHPFRGVLVILLLVDLVSMFIMLYFLATFSVLHFLNNTLHTCVKNTRNTDHSGIFTTILQRHPWASFFFTIWHPYFLDEEIQLQLMVYYYILNVNPFFQHLLTSTWRKIDKMITHPQGAGSIFVIYKTSLPCNGIRFMEAKDFMIWKPKKSSYNLLFLFLIQNLF